MPTLADIYSAIDSAKRKGSDLIRNPGASLQQIAGLALDRANAARDQLYQATEEEGIGYGPKTKALAQKMAESYNPMGMTVWHGSPYKFTKFDASKIGTGEGNQAYGHGLYVAENPNVAKQYAENVKDTASIAEYNAKLGRLSKLMDEDALYPGAYRKFKSAKGEQAAQEYDALMEQKLQKVKDPGTLYKVDLPDEHIEKMLDWDQPLSQQHPEVRKKLLKHPDVIDYIKKAEEQRLRLNESSPMRLQKIPSASIPFDENRMYGKDVLSAIQQRSAIGKNGFAEQQLRDLGIPGIKYFDESSREAKKGTRNFVVFPGNEHLLSIQDLNGNPVK